MKKGVKKAIVITLSLVAFICLLLGGMRAYFRFPLSNYYKASEKAFLIPGLKDNFVPQGLYYNEEDKTFLVSGYNTKSASSVYLVNEAGESKRINLAYEGGSAFGRHAGGVAVYQDWVYVAGSSAHAVFIYSYSEMKNAQNGASVKALGRFSLENPDDENDYISVSALTVANGFLVVNEFHYDDGYEGLDSHNYVTQKGDKHGGVAVFYELDQNLPFGINPNMIKAFSICDKVQGMAFHNGKIYCSTSLGFAFSEIYVYNEYSLKQESFMTLLGKKVPLYALDSSCLRSFFKAPPMAEGMVVVDNKLYIMSEFACNKYILGKFTSAKWCYAKDLSKD